MQLVAKRASLTDPNGARVLEPVFEQRRKVSRQRSLSNPDMSDMRRLSEVVYVHAHDGCEGPGGRQARGRVGGLQGRMHECKFTEPSAWLRTGGLCMRAHATAGASISDLAETYGAAYGELVNDGSHYGGGLHPGHADDGGSTTDGASDLDEPLDTSHSPSSPGRGGVADDYVNAADVLGLGGDRAASPMATPAAAPARPSVGGLIVGGTALNGPPPPFPTFGAGPYPPGAYGTSPPGAYGAVPYPYFVSPQPLPFGVAPLEGAQQPAVSRQAVADATAAAVQAAATAGQPGPALPHHANRRRRVSMSAADRT